MSVPLEHALRDKESHGVEFKKSLGERAEAAQTVTAFANAHGGSLFFGVDPTGEVVGIDIGANTLEQLAAELDRHIYPYSPAAIDPVTASNGRRVIRLSVVPDTPPVIGVYLYSSRRLDPAERVRVDRLHAYRRVGRTNREVPDFMWLRPRLPTDPLLLIEFSGQQTGPGFPRQVIGSVWMPADSGVARELLFKVEPGLAAPQLAGRNTLPHPDGPRGNPIKFQFMLDQPAQPADGLWLIAEFEDDWACVWESRRYLSLVPADNGMVGFQPTAKMSRRILELPPQRGTA